jgi:hypothetical protein
VDRDRPWSRIVSAVAPSDGIADDIDQHRPIALESSLQRAAQLPPPFYTNPLDADGSTAARAVRAPRLKSSQWRIV